MNQRLLAVAATAALLVGCAESEPPSESATTAPPADTTAATTDTAGTNGADGANGTVPDVITAERGGFVPEGIAYDSANERFLVGSMAEGSVFEVSPDGTLTEVVTDPELVSSLGIEVDDARDRLLVTNADASAFETGGTGLAQLGIYDLETGERLAMVDLATAITDAPEDASFLANDVAVGEDGSAYVTDTMQNVVYRVGPDQEVSVLHRVEGQPGLNGIVYDDDGYLLVVGLMSGELYKVPVEDPMATARVSIPEPLEGGDGMVWTADGDLAVVSNSTSRVIVLASNDDWSSAEVAGIGSFEGQGTTAAVAGDDLYVVKPHFDDQEPPTIERVAIE